MTETICPKCGKPNYTEEAPREYHAECWRAIGEIETILAAAGPTFDGGTETSRREIATEWDEDFTPAQVGRWVEAGCWDASTALSLADAGFRPTKDELRYKAGHERDDMDPMYALCNSDTSIEKLSW